MPHERRPKATSSEQCPESSRSAEGEAPPTPLMICLFAEMLGAFALVAIDAGGAAVGALSPEVTAGMRALAAGLTICALVYALGERSGAHFNPAVSVAFAIRGVFPWGRVLPYVSAQLLGGVAAAILVSVGFGPGANAGVNHPGAAFGTVVAAGAEVVFTFLLVTVVLATATQAKVLGPNAAIASGATVALCNLVGKPVSGASMNPARSLAPALVQQDLRHCLIYVAGPLLGAMLAVGAVTILHPRRRSDEVDAAMGKRKTAN